MKKWIFLLMIAVLMATTSCGNEPSIEEKEVQTEDIEIQEIENLELENLETEDLEAEDKSTDGIDVDLTTLSATMVYAEVYNMIYYPESYIGKIVKMKGAFNVSEDPNTGKIYFAVIISDATECCMQGMEFTLKGDYSYPEDYPEQDTEITVVGEFETYEEDGVLYCQLKDASMI